MVQYYERFISLETKGILDPSSNSDLYCLHTVFLPIMQVTMDKFYLELRMQRKRRSTKNPNYPKGERGGNRKVRGVDCLVVSLVPSNTAHSFLAGTHRRKRIYTMLPSAGTPLTASNLDDLRIIGTGYWAAHKPESFEPRAWEQDPVQTGAGRARRSRMVARKNPSTPEEHYRVFRQATRLLSARGQ